MTVFTREHELDELTARETSMDTIDQIPVQTAMQPAEAAKDGGAPAVAVEDLRKSFGSQKVLNGISLTVSRGETLAVLGRSGTGKSVLLRLIIGLEKPDSGSVLIHAQDIAGLALDQLGEIRMKMGFLFQHAALYDSLTVEQNVAFPLRHRGKKMSKSERGDRVTQLLAEVGMEGHQEKMPSDISGGMQKRVGLARALALEPDILLLDEPTAGLDPQSRRQLWTRIEHLRQQGGSILLTTHSMEEAQAVCDRVAIIDNGMVLTTETPRDLIEKHKDDPRVRAVAHGEVTLEDVFIGLTGSEIRE